jgi:hypothetical protein
MRIQFMNGTKIDMTWHEMQRALRHPFFVGLVLITSAIIIILRPDSDVVQLNTVGVTLFYANGVVVFMTLLLSSLYASHRLGKTVITAVVITFSVVWASIWGLYFATLLGAEKPEVSDYFLVTAFNLTFGFLAEVIFSTFLLPPILKDIRGGGTKERLATFIEDTTGALPVYAPTPQPHEVEVLGQRFARSQILYVQAEEHYVRVTLQDGQSQLLRGKISDACDDLRAVSGMRVHRSHWVAAGAVVGWRADRAGHGIETALGTTIPVARNRQTEVKAWAQSLLRLQEMKKAPVKGA